MVIIESSNKTISSASCDVCTVGVMVSYSLLTSTSFVVRIIGERERANLVVRSSGITMYSYTVNHAHALGVSTRCACAVLTKVLRRDDRATASER